MVFALHVFSKGIVLLGRRLIMVLTVRTTVNFLIFTIAFNLVRNRKSA